jgi:hypothetical protein
VSNAERVRVVLLDDKEDPSAHAIAPKATVGAPVSSRLADSATAARTWCRSPGRTASSTTSSPKGPLLVLRLGQSITEAEVSRCGAPCE